MNEQETTKLNVFNNNNVKFTPRGEGGSGR